ncbi:MAG: hypothetical protein CFE43_02515 [Burkholderiales bacterium PBB3]|nr:MAG: hypothetical protein CFE43_02515 [Burkholderiales bacterium PBB3]
MTVEADSAIAASPAAALSDCAQALALLRQQGADQLSPVDFHYMEALAQRLGGQAPHVRHILEGKLAVALAAYRARFALTQSDVKAPQHQAAPAHATVQTPLGELVRAMAHHTAEPEARSWIAARNSRTELKSVRNFRNTWSKLSAQKQVSQALGQAPKNAGPINSHMLVLRSLELMRDISPDYLNRFMSYADTLLCLDQSDLSAKPATKKAATRVKAATPT